MTSKQHSETKNYQQNNNFKFNINNRLKNKLNNINENNKKRESDHQQVDLAADCVVNNNALDEYSAENNNNFENTKNFREALNNINSNQNNEFVNQSINDNEDIINKNTKDNKINDSQMSNNSYIVPIINERDIVKDNSNSAAIIAYLNDKIRYLEVENNSLRDEIKKNHNFTEKEKIDYYLRLRKELIEENEKLISEKKMREISYKGELDKLKLEVIDLKNKLKLSTSTNLLNMSKPEEIKVNNDKNNNQNINNNNSSIRNVNDDNSNQIKTLTESFANTKYFKTCEAVLKSEDDKAAIQKLLKEQKDRQVGPKNSIYNLNKKDHNNPFIPVIDDLEERVKLLEKTIHEKDAEIQELNEVINTNEQIAGRAQSALRVEINKWKEKYLLILATRKTISQEFSELNIKTTENIKRSMAKQTYDMETKILHLEKLNYKLNEDMKNIVNADHDHDKQKLNEIVNLKRDLKALLENYDDLYRNYEESLKILTKQIDSIKQLYLTRENEFINITHYYIETLNDFSKPVSDILNNPNNVRTLEDSLLVQNKQTEDMRKTAEKYIKENSMIKSENFESKAIMRQKINDAMKFYDDSIKNISDNHNTIEQKLTKISEFMETFDQKFVLFNSLIEDKKLLTDKVNELEVKIRMINNDDQTKEILRLRESNFKLSKELESKVQLMKDMEEISEYLFAHQTENHLKNKSMTHNKTITNYNNITQTQGSFASNMHNAMKSNIGYKDDKYLSSNNKGNIDSPRKVRAKDASFETVMKMKGEIAMLNSKMMILSKSKEEIEYYYQEEMKKLLASLEEKNEQIDELKNALEKNQNEHFAKKETIFNLWMIEFKEFKENLITISDIRNIIDKFKIEGGELKIQRESLVNEEIYLLRQEIKTKDKSISDLKANYKKENNSLNDLFEQYKKNIEGRISSLDLMISQRDNEITALKNEKKRLSDIENRKREVSYMYNII